MAFSNSWTGTVIIVLLVIFFIAQAFVIPSGSMKNTLLIGDNLFVKKFSYGIATPRIPWIEVPILPDFDGDGHIFSGEGPKRGDVVIFRYPEDEKIHYVKRCVAIGGDWLMVVNKNLFLRPHEGDDFIKANYPAHKIYDINGYLWVQNPMSEEHVGIHTDDSVTDNGVYPPQLFNFGPIIVPENNYFMMGDNRDHSNDSRFWGFVPYKYIVGKPWFIYFSMDDSYKIRWDRMFKSVETIESEMLKAKNGK
ncbi:MAG: signal peptidase I [Campylobacterales bacterium]|nr:signal peptidase I [Campylobacterales bacterium]